ncbi:TPA: porin [Neisseria meningitidis]|uniref:Major outer membrane protein P.IA n=11 Tax=Neisseria meningitidis TaxID=487 RepID=OMPA1_NEIMC|nr:porin [Neisseria meningitidis]P13415.1 RecName: Full=Major outer membrane protein P.IA; Short=PIA; Short=Protein IA; AltName: Full=Class 1 protein; Flags: Precursor [Neisseria meningitidis serogroup C]EGC65002.1 major outer membrane protein IA [Neisseria meningitidis 961-5945]EOC09576.1 major outer membrane protein P.IA [Neisseria meningitidis 73696]MBG8583921.1 porin [Neisseria meningitidis]MBG9089990.1 porin [Neisseria meningitidis]MDM1030267.1 membrane protein [Neisseria meningitidis]
MRKKLTALVLSALPLAAVADVSLYGEIKAGVEGRNIQAQLTEQPQVTNGVQGNQVKVTKAKSRIRTKISDFGSFIGFKGSEDLGEGLKAVWQLEQDVSVAGGGASQWGNRESFIGLAGEFGTLRAGRVANQFDDASQAINPWDSNNDVASQLGIFKRHDDMPVSVRYDSPEFSGFSGSVQFVPAQNSKSAYKPAYYTKDTNNNLTLVPAVVGKPGSDVYYAGLNYKNGGFAGNYAFKYARHANVGRNAFELFLIGSATSDEAKGTDPLKNHQVHRLTGGYEEGGLNLALAAQLDLSENGDKAKTKNSTTEIAATASYRFGNAVPRISYAHGFDLIERGKKGENTSYDQIIAGVDYDFSKRTSAIVSGAWLKRNTGIGNYTQINAASVGLRHKF